MSQCCFSELRLSESGINRQSVGGQNDSIDFTRPLGFIIKSSSDPDIPLGCGMSVENTRKLKTGTQGAPEMEAQAAPGSPAIAGEVRA